MYNEDLDTQIATLLRCTVRLTQLARSTYVPSKEYLSEAIDEIEGLCKDAEDDIVVGEIESEEDGQLIR